MRVEPAKRWMATLASQVMASASQVQKEKENERKRERASASESERERESKTEKAIQRVRKTGEKRRETVW